MSLFEIQNHNKKKKKNISMWSNSASNISERNSYTYSFWLSSFDIFYFMSHVIIIWIIFTVTYLRLPSLFSSAYHIVSLVSALSNSSACRILFVSRNFPKDAALQAKKIRLLNSKRCTHNTYKHQNLNYNFRENISFSKEI